MNSIKRFILAGTAAIFFIGLSLAAQAQTNPNEKGQNMTKFENSDTAAKTLGRHLGKKVTVFLKSGKELTGKVKTMGMSACELEALEGQEFFNAIINLDSIEAIVLRVRES